jgi:7-cyano-7-deazaguanine reductase
MRVAHALAHVAFLIAVAQLNRLVRSGRSAGRHAGTATRAVGKDDVDLDGRVAAAIENFPADNVDDGSHAGSRLNLAAASTGSARLLSCPGKRRVPNPHAGTNYVARFTFPEFTVMCPVTGQPDFATLVIDYVPKSWLVESKSLKLYLNSFRNHGAFHEECTVAIGKKLVALLRPKWLRIGGYFHPRGGMPIDVFWQAGRLPAGVWVPEQGITTYRARS